MIARWCRVAARWHAVDESQPLMLRCGGKLLEDPETVTGTEAEPYPPDACDRCKLEVAMDDVEDEPMEEAKARGYVPWTPLPEDPESIIG